MANVLEYLPNGMLKNNLSMELKPYYTMDTTFKLSGDIYLVWLSKSVRSLQTMFKKANKVTNKDKRKNKNQTIDKVETSIYYRIE